MLSDLRPRRPRDSARGFEPSVPYVLNRTLPRWLRWRGLAVPSYPSLLYVGVVAGLVVQNHVAIRLGLPSARIYVATLLLFVMGLVGARLLFVLSHWPIYRREPARIWRRSEGGLALYGAVPVTLIVSVPLLRALDLPLGTFWDVATVPMLLGALVTKVGCLLNGCCGGRPTLGPIGIRLHDQWGVVQRRIPAQLLEIGWLGLLLVALRPLAERRPFPGAVYLSVLGGYGLGRLFLETTREEQDRLGSWSVHKIIAAAITAACAVTLLSAWPRH